MKAVVVQQVFEELGLKFYDMGEFYAAKEFSDVWYFLVPDIEEGWRLKAGLGEWEDDIVFVDAEAFRNHYILFNYVMPAITILWCLLMGFWFFAYSLFWVGILFMVALAIVIPRYTRLKAKWRVIPRLSRAGMNVQFGGVVHLIHPKDSFFSGPERVRKCRRIP